MPSVSRNIVANIAGSVWLGLMGLAFVPVYLHYIGVEGYGLVGFFLMVTSLLTILDGGLGVAAARELATSQGDGDAQSVCDLVHTVEWLFWGVAVMLGALFVAAAPWIAEQWLNPESLAHATTVDALRLLGAILMLQWPATYYNACVVGLQRQVGLNLIQVIMATARSAGAALVLWLISPTVQAFFVWQLLVALLQVVTLRWYLWRCMPRTAAPRRFDLRRVYDIGRFSAGVGGINALALLLSQIDKVILSKILPLQQFGYYVLASTLVGTIARLTGPMFNALFPRLAQIVRAGDAVELTCFYHRAAQAMALVIVPLSLVLVFFGEDAIAVWTGNSELAGNLRWVVAALAVGTMLNGLMALPYGLQLAHGWTALSFWANLFSVILIVPLTCFMATRFGLVGAALTWPILNGMYVVLGAPLMHRRLLRAEMRLWFAYAVLLPIGAVSLIMGTAKLALQDLSLAASRPLAFLFVSAVFAVCVAVTAFILPAIRKPLLAGIETLFLRAGRMTG